MIRSSESSVSYKRDYSGIYFFVEISVAEFGPENYSCSSEVIFSFFFSFTSVSLMVSASYSLISVVFLFSKCFGAFLIRKFYSFRYFHSMVYFSIPNSIPIWEGVMVKPLDYGIVVRDFELQSRYYVHFRQIPLGKI